VFDKQVLRQQSGEDPEYLCFTCHENILQGKVPKLCFSNGFEFPQIPEELKGLTQLEERLVAARIPFMRIQKLGIDRQCGLKGNVINIVNPVNKTASILPRNFDDDSILQVMMMRKMEYKTAYCFETVRPKKVYEAAQYLSKTQLHQDEGIVLSDEWSSKCKNEEIQFFYGNQSENICEPVKIDSILKKNDPEHAQINIANECIDANFGQETLILDFDAIENSTAVKFAPGEGQKPLSLLKDTNAEALSFPTIYCGEPRIMKRTDITRTDIAKSDARNRDRRCAIPSKLLYSYKLSQTFQIAGQISTCLRKKKSGNSTITAANMLDNDFLDKILQHDDGYRLLKNIRSSPAYWQDRQKVLLAMIRQYGIPTLFLTLSAAEIKWNELMVILKSVLDNQRMTESECEALTWEQKTDLIRRDPITCSRYFDYRLRQCNKFIILNKTGLFKDYPVVDFFQRIEFQNRGSPHMHGLLWLQGAPKFDENEPESFEACSR